ncbi:uncharacterized protein EV420DRAFT_1644244 [Desarmillaria tabescens]|uniref:Ribonuclease H1 N-terminal domain-containing protein n=1 Tax=Armillaria tabescens TaxID=1929756 RepID=A0AA39KC31_ARMTA|nr:uncharacterized protein EV420DRAFT_1644244 [Desarmillaria tabescens]KAK0457089.1 hypothetical protein EV420DRAFT_1644244 [Desarmillaria tabescens]
MTQFTPEQLASVLAALGIMPPEATPTTHNPDSPVNDKKAASMVEVPLHSFYCFNCAFPNVVPINAIPVATTIIQPACHGSAPVRRDSPLTGLLSTSLVSAPMAQATVAPAPASSPATAADPTTVTPTIQGSSIPGPSTVRASEGSWYAVSKGLAIGVFQGWQNVSPLVTGVCRACYFCHSSQAATQEAFNQAVVTATVEILH